MKLEALEAEITSKLITRVRSLLGYVSLISNVIKNGSTKLLPLLTKPKNILRNRLGDPRNIFWHSLESYLDFCPTSKMKNLSKNLSELQVLTIFAKTSPMDFCHCSEYASFIKKIGLSYSFKGNNFWEPLGGVAWFEMLFQTKYSRMEHVKVLTFLPLENMGQCGIEKIRISAVNLTF